MREKIVDIQKKIKLIMKIKNIVTWIMGKVTIIRNILTIRSAINDAVEARFQR